MRRRLARRPAAPRTADRSVARNPGGSRPGNSVDAGRLHRPRPAEQHPGAATAAAGRTERHRALHGPLQPSARPECLDRRRRLLWTRPDQRQHLPQQQPDLGISQRLRIDAPVPGHADQPPDQGRETGPGCRHRGSRTDPRGCGDQRHDALPAGALQQGDGRRGRTPAGAEHAAGTPQPANWPPPANSPNRPSTKARRLQPTTA